MLLITVLVVDQVVRLRQVSDRSRAIAAQAAIMVVQARRTVQAVTQAVAKGAADSDRDAASDELRTYMMMLLVAAPLLIDIPVSRSFLEQAQALGGRRWPSLGSREARRACTRGTAGRGNRDGCGTRLQGRGPRENAGKRPPPGRVTALRTPRCSGSSTPRRAAREASPYQPLAARIGGAGGQTTQKVPLGRQAAG